MYEPSHDAAWARLTVFISAFVIPVRQQQERAYSVVCRCENVTKHTAPVRPGFIEMEKLLLNIVCQIRHKKRTKIQVPLLYTSGFPS